MVVDPIKGSYRDYWHIPPTNAKYHTGSVRTERNYGKYMARDDFEDITRNIHFTAPEAMLPIDERDPYWEVRNLVDKFNEWRNAYVEPGPYLVVDECMSGWDGMEHKYSTKGCPGLTFIPRKPLSRGVEIKACCDGMSNVMLFIEIQEGKERMKKKEPTAWIKHLGQSCATTLRLVRNWVNTGRTVIGDAWFGSFKCVQALHAFLGLFAIMIIKTAHTIYPLQFLKQWGSTIKREARGTHKLCKSSYKLQKAGEPILPSDAPSFDIFALGWQDKKTKTIIFNKGTTEVADALKRKRSKVRINDDRSAFTTEEYVLQIKTCAVVRTLFENFPKIDIHDHYRQGSLQFHKNWSTKSWWHRLYSNILAMIITDAYFIYRYEWLDFTRGDKSDLLEFPDFIDRLAYGMIHYSDPHIEAPLPPVADPDLLDLEVPSAEDTVGLNEVWDRHAPIPFCTLIDSKAKTSRVRGKQLNCFKCRARASTFCKGCSFPEKNVFHPLCKPFEASTNKDCFSLHWASCVKNGK